MKELSFNEMEVLEGGECSLENFAHVSIAATLGTMAGGAVAGSILPGAGTVIGAVGGMITGYVGSSVTYGVMCLFE